MKRQVPLVTLDALLGERGCSSVDLLKIDAEGYDLFVMLGAREALASRRIGVIQFEYNVAWFDAGARLTKALDLLRSNGYAVYMLRAEGLPASRGTASSSCIRTSSLCATTATSGSGR